MGKAARIKRQRTEPFEHEPKRPTGVYRTAKERQESRRRERKQREALSSLVETVAADLRGNRG